jgi:uncharacterized membrane protein
LIGILVYIIVLAVKTGQGGSRIKTPVKEGGTGNINRDDDRFWKAGLFYFNPDDPSIMVEKRFGVGYTLNFGNRKAIWFSIAFFVLILLIPIVIIPSISC